MSSTQQIPYVVRAKITTVSMTSKDDWQAIVANAKFTEISQLLMTKVGINNFIHLSLVFETSLLLRDIIVNSPFVSAWGRSTQVLNNDDSRFSVYRPILTHYDDYHDLIIKEMEELYSSGHVMDNIRMLVPLGSMTNFAISIDIMTAVKLVFVLENVQGELSFEAQTLSTQLRNIIKEQYNITEETFVAVKPSYMYDIDKDFQYTCKDLKNITGLEVHSAPVTYSVIGQVLRHRTIHKNFNINLEEIKKLTSEYDYSFIETPSEISKTVKNITSHATSLYECVQGSIATLNFSGFKPYVDKMLNQRSCCINDTKQFAGIMPNSAIPPCKCNVEKFGCYVSYVNESRLKNEELTQVPCPIWAESRGISTFTKNSKYDWFYNNIISWRKWKERTLKSTKSIK